MSDVYHCSPTNSTFFTTCCRTAICDHQRQCPRCREFVYPDYKDDEKHGIERTEHQRHMARWGRAHGPHRRSQP